MNGVQIFHEINAFIGDRKNKQWRAAGADIGRALEKLIIGQEMRKQIMEEDDDRYEQIVDIITGAAKGMKITLERECISDSKTFVGDMEKIVADLEEGSFVSANLRDFLLLQ